MIQDGQTGFELKTFRSEFCGVSYLSSQGNLRRRGSGAGPWRLFRQTSGPTSASTSRPPSSGSGLTIWQRPCRPSETSDFSERRSEIKKNDTLGAKWVHRCFALAAFSKEELK